MSRNTDSRTDIVVDGQPPRRRRLLVFVLAGLAVAVFGGGATLSYYVDALWFGSLGYTSVFWTRLNLEAATSERLPSSRSSRSMEHSWR